LINYRRLERRFKAEIALFDGFPGGKISYICKAA
jgi:hypothetical protein